MGTTPPPNSVGLARRAPARRLGAPLTQIMDQHLWLTLGQAYITTHLPLLAGWRRCWQRSTAPASVWAPRQRRQCGAWRRRGGAGGALRSWTPCLCCWGPSTRRWPCRWGRRRSWRDRARATPPHLQDMGLSFGGHLTPPASRPASHPREAGRSMGMPWRSAAQVPPWCDHGHMVQWLLST